MAVVMHRGREASAVWWQRLAHRLFFSPYSKRDIVFIIPHSVFCYGELVLKQEVACEPVVSNTDELGGGAQVPSYSPGVKEK